MLLHLHAKPLASIAAAAWDLCTHLCLSRGCTAGGGGSTSSLLCSCPRTSKVFLKAFPSARRSRCERPGRRALKKDRSTFSSRRLRESTVVKPSASSHETIRVVISEAPSCTICAARPGRPLPLGGPPRGGAPRDGFLPGQSRDWCPVLSQPKQVRWSSGTSGFEQSRVLCSPRSWRTAMAVRHQSACAMASYDEPAPSCCV